MSDEKPKRPPTASDSTVAGKRAGTMSDEDRALAELDRRRRAATPVEGIPNAVPIVDTSLAEDLARLAALEEELSAEADDFDEQFTPVREVLGLAGNPRERNLAIALWAHSANQELRFRRARNRSSEAKLRKDIDANTTAIVDITGASGSNGKVGELRRRVDVLSSRAWLLLTAFFGGLGAAAIKLVMVVRAFDAVEAKANHATHQIHILQAQVMTLQTALIVRRPYRSTEGTPSP